MKQTIYNIIYKTKKIPSLILIDAMPLSFEKTLVHNIPTLSLINGESKSASIAAASIVAKVIRDKLMAQLHCHIPAYNLYKHQGYATKEHVTQLQRYKPSIIHRSSFLKKIMKENNGKQLPLFC